MPVDAPDFLLCVASDGAGSSTHGGEGASLVCRTFSLAAQQHLATFRTLPGDEHILGWLDTIRDRIGYAAEKRRLTKRDFAATMIALVSDGKQTVVAQVGDVCAVLRDSSAGWRLPMWPDHGEYASTTTFVTDDPAAKCRIWREGSDISAVAVLTDGLERLALDFAARLPSPGFFDAMAKPVADSVAVGRDQHLSARLKVYLEGQAICARTDDDKTLIVATRR